MRQCVACLGTVACCLTGPLAAQTAPEPPSLPLLERFIGLWTMTGTVRARPVTYRLEGRWVLQHRFVELQMEDVEHTPHRYEARVFIGPDTLSGHVVVHWLDNFGAAYSVPPAIGVAAGDSLTLDFPYPDAAFHDTFVYDATAGSWTIRLDAAAGKGGWKRFADYRAVRR
jgi:hypothetical protein